MTPANPFRTALKFIGILGLSIGGFLLLIAIAVQANAMTSALQYGTITDPSGYLVAYVLGGWLIGLGVMGLLLWLVVSSVGWDATLERPEPKRTTLTPEEITALLDRKAERG